MSIDGRPTLIFEDHCYFKHLVNRSGMTRWRCNRNRFNCKAVVWTFELVLYKCKNELPTSTNYNFIKKPIMCKLIDKEQPLPSSDETGPSAPKMKRRCYYCPRSKDKKSTIVCKSCRKTICKPHSVAITYCLPCLPK
ncbi:hypothetical protein PYW07_016433 [Mythimna separata]|uniref:FLYWCH-type domain-containing protein n=1 Tax=Mythimna separata TaxID=271217 RepID=A0AAD8DRT7_MYTSE|nr:hypothetical protein PYW07_016433 [Mythimna separata]